MTLIALKQLDLDLYRYNIIWKLLIKIYIALRGNKSD